jgi:hypothetical protein
MVRGRNIARDLRHSKKCMQFRIGDLTATALHYAAVRSSDFHGTSVERRSKGLNLSLLAVRHSV